MIDLAGSWELHLGDEEAASYESHVTLPGDLASQGFGSEPSLDTEWTGDIIDRGWYEDPAYAPYRVSGSIKVPFWLQPERRYVGAAWLRRSVDIPQSFVGRRLRLFLERPHWETRLWMDGKYLGSNDSLSVPHEYDLGIVREAGARCIALRVDNRVIVPVGPNSHSIADHTQGNWNGIVGSIALFADSAVRVASAEAYSSLRRRSILFRISVANDTGGPIAGELRIGPDADNGGEADARRPLAVELAAGETELCIESPFPEGAKLWDEFSPELTAFEISLSAGDRNGAAYEDSKRVELGLREISVEGSRIAINGRSLFLRGSLECCAFPATGYPPTDLESWMRELRTMQEHGLNHLRFHSWCPPDAAFDAADRLGLYLQIECSTWANQGAKVGVDPRYDSWLFRESERIVRRNGNHPSFIMLASGNEPDGRTEDFLGQWVSYWRGRDPRRLYTSASGWPAIDENQYHVIPKPRIQAWGEGLGSRINALPPETASDYSDIVDPLKKPVIGHEIGQWCSFPSIEDGAKYKGILRPRNYEIFKDFLAKNGLEGKAREFVYASGKLQAACYKEEIESSLRTHSYAGFQLLGLSDFPGQGTATVGVLDAFWESKGYIEPEEFREFCSSTVPLIRMAKRYWLSTERLCATIEVAHFGPERIERGRVAWSILDHAGAEVISGSFDAASIETGELTRIGEIDVSLDELPTALRYQVVVSVCDHDADAIIGRNRWDIWLFDEGLEAGPVGDGILETSKLDESAGRHLATGGSLLFCPPPEDIKGDVELGYSSIFWNTAWTGGQAPHTLGLVCDERHPVFARFPTRAYSDWLWWEPIHGAAAAIMDELPRELAPMAQPIDTWFRSHKLGLIFEARVGSGRLLFCGMDIASDLERRHVARQLRRSLVSYMRSDTFKPLVDLSLDELKTITKRRVTRS